jgi:ABC-type transport system substrate-binding protein
MALERRGGTAVLTMKRPAERGLPEEENWIRHVRPVELQATSAVRAVGLFGQGDVDLVLGGTLASLPLAPTGPLSRGTVHLDPVAGLFGLQVRNADGFLADPRNREAIAMAIDRAALIAPFNIGGWAPSTRIVPPSAPGTPAPAERWSGQPIASLRSQAAARVSRWRAGHAGTPVKLTASLPEGPGSDMLFGELAGQLSLAGIALQRVPDGARADLVLIDRVARFPDTRWYLDQLACSLRQGLCDPGADALVGQAGAAPDAPTQAALMAQAEAHLTDANVFIPFGSPIRFSLVRSNVTGFAANPWAFHPLPPLAAIPR